MVHVSPDRLLICQALIESSVGEFCKVYSNQSAKQNHFQLLQKIVRDALSQPRVLELLPLVWVLHNSFYSRAELRGCKQKPYMF